MVLPCRVDGNQDISINARPDFTRADSLMFWRLPCRVVSNLIKGMGADRMGGLAELDGFLQARPPQEVPVSLADQHAGGERQYSVGDGGGPQPDLGACSLP